MEVICLQDDAFYALIETVVKRIKESEKIQDDDFMNTVDAMTLLGIKSKATLQKLRDNGSIDFSQHSKKVILYSRKSIIEYLKKHLKRKF
jgi:hypothetical protein